MLKKEDKRLTDRINTPSNKTEEKKKQREEGLT